MKLNCAAAWHSLLPQYELRLVASDNLNENYTTIVIHVNDVNDNPPVFDRPTYETQITEEDDRNLPKRVLQVIKPIDLSSTWLPLLIVFVVLIAAWFSSALLIVSFSLSFLLGLPVVRLDARGL
jgi:hypothetical protein